MFNVGAVVGTAVGGLQMNYGSSDDDNDNDNDNNHDDDNENDNEFLPLQKARRNMWDPPRKN